MSEWWAYSLSDFLLFSPRTYYRLIERHNAAVWPGHVLTLALGFGIVGLLIRPTRWQGRVISAIVAVLWAWVAWEFLGTRYVTINWAAIYFAWLFAIEVLLLLWIGLVRNRLSFRLSGDAAGLIGLGLFVTSVAFYPMVAPVLGRGWRHAEVFGVAPDPTVIGTLGLLLLVEGYSRWGLLAVPVLWCAVSGATLWAMGSVETWALALTALLALGGAGWSRSGQRAAHAETG
jgi:hypothetical protein